MIETLAVPLRQKEASARSASIFLGKQPIFPQEIFFKACFAAFAKFFKTSESFSTF